MERESTTPEPAEDLLQHDKENFIRHFKDRDKVEKELFGDLCAEELFSGIQSLNCSPQSLNSEETIEFARKSGADMCVVFGPDLLSKEFLQVLPEDSVNLHLGLSPWYKGSATLFWPFYNLQPQYAGATIHKLTVNADAGGIVHQLVPKLEYGQGIHDVAGHTVLKASEDIISVLDYKRTNGELPGIHQKTQGRLYLSMSFRPEHLRVIYDLYDNDLVDYFLKGEIATNLPKLITLSSFD